MTGAGDEEALRALALPQPHVWALEHGLLPRAGSPVAVPLTGVGDWPVPPEGVVLALVAGRGWDEALAAELEAGPGVTLPDREELVAEGGRRAVILGQVAVLHYEAEEWWALIEEAPVVARLAHALVPQRGLYELPDSLAGALLARWRAGRGGARPPAVL